MVGPLFVPFLVGLFPRPHRHRPFPQYDRPSGSRTVILGFLYIRLTGPSQPRPLSSVVASGGYNNHCCLANVRISCFIHSFITSIYIAPLQVGLLRGAPTPNTTK